MFPTFHLYGLFIGIGAYIGLELSKRAYRKLWMPDSGNTFPLFDDLFVWVLTCGIVGARLYHVIDLWEYYSMNPVEIFKFWQGGLGIYGAIGGGLVGLWAYHKLRQPQIDFIRVLDAVSLGLPVAQAVGRLGNLFNQELFGLPTRLPWGLFIDASNRPAAYAQFERFHPLFAYEAIGNLILAVLLWRLARPGRRPGWYFALYLSGYGFIRFWLDFLRIDPWRMGWFTTAQWISLGFVGVGLYFFRYRKKMVE